MYVALICSSVRLAPFIELCEEVVAVVELAKLSWKLVTPFEFAYAGLVRMEGDVVLLGMVLLLEFCLKVELIFAYRKDVGGLSCVGALLCLVRTEGGTLVGGCVGRVVGALLAVTLFVCAVGIGGKLFSVGNLEVNLALFIPLALEVV